MDVQQELRRRGCAFFCLNADVDSPSPLKELIARAALSLSEDFPVLPFVEWSRFLVRSFPSAFWVVDPACVLPMQAAENSYARAYRFCKDFWREFESRVSRRYEEQETNVRPFAGRFGFESIDLASTNVV